MGILDEAIKEHLDLKRRRGADPAEVERAEREALGPVRRAPSSQSEEVANEQPAEAGLAYDHEEEIAWSGQPLEHAARGEAGLAGREHDLESDFGEDPHLELEPEPEPEHRPSRLSRIFGRTDPQPEAEQPTGARPPARAADAPDPFDEPDSDAATPRAHPVDAQLGDETSEYDVQQALDEAEPADGEDVLEETPEFLQDTPDHDRLWFEQRPPKDFDFDG